MDVGLGDPSSKFSFADLQSQSTGSLSQGITILKCLLLPINFLTLGNLLTSDPQFTILSLSINIYICPCHTIRAQMKITDQRPTITALASSCGKWLIMYVNLYLFIKIS